jgi:hypothetical protein
MVGTCRTREWFTSRYPHRSRKSPSARLFLSTIFFPFPANPGTTAYFHLASQNRASIESRAANNQGGLSPVQYSIKIWTSMLIYNTVRAICLAHTNITSAILINDVTEHQRIRTRDRALLHSVASAAHRGTPNGMPICRLLALQSPQQCCDDLPNTREILVQRVCRGVLAEATFKHSA